MQDYPIHEDHVSNKHCMGSIWAPGPQNMMARNELCEPDGYGGVHMGHIELRMTALSVCFHVLNALISLI